MTAGLPALSLFRIELMNFFTKLPPLLCAEGNKKTFTHSTVLCLDKGLANFVLNEASDPGFNTVMTNPNRMSADATPLYFLKG